MVKGAFNMFFAAILERMQSLISCSVAASAAVPFSGFSSACAAVSYTHLDVYKRQQQASSFFQAHQVSLLLQGGQHPRFARLVRAHERVPVSYTHLDVYKRQCLHFPRRRTVWA